MSVVEDTEKLWNYNLMCEKNVQKINHYTIQNVKLYKMGGKCYGSTNKNENIGGQNMETFNKEDNM